MNHLPINRAPRGTVHQSMIEEINVPEDDYFQVIRQHEKSEFFYDPFYLQVERTDELIYIHFKMNVYQFISTLDLEIKWIIKKFAFFMLPDDLKIVIFRHIDFFNHRLVDSPAGCSINGKVIQRLLPPSLFLVGLPLSYLIA